MKKLGRYDLIRVLGKGAMGLVYEGRDPNLDRRVAIKTIKVENLTSEEAADYEVRFRTEARSAARLQHPHIVSVFDSDRDGDVAFLVMEFIDGEDLKHHLDRGEVYTLGQTVGIMADLLSAMDYAHRQGIVHRDIKPANLLMEPGGRLKLTDFGVARIQDSGDATRTQGSMVGTLKYMSPEQVQGFPIDARSDLFAAGVVLYQLLTSKRPFDGISDFDVIQKIVGQDPDLPSKITPGLPTAIDSVVARALAKSRDARYATAQEFHTDLVSALQSGTDQTITPKAGPVTRARTNALSSGAPPFGASVDSSSGSSSSVVTQEAELVYWKDVKDSTESADFEGFLRRFPHGIYADLARTKLKRLGAIEGDGVSQSTFAATVIAPRVFAPISSDEATVVAKPPASQPVISTSEAPSGSPVSAARLHRWLWGLGGLVLVAGGAVAVSSAMRVSESTTQPTEMPVQPITAVSAPVLLPASAPAAPVAEAVLKLPASSAAPAQRPVAAKITPSAAVAASASASSLPVKPKTLPSAPKPTTEPKVSKANESAATPIVDPRTTCEGRWLLSYQICLSKECSKPELAQLPICVERHAQERKHLEKNGL